MNKKIIISVVIVLLGIVVVSGVFLQDMDEIPPVGNITPNETRVTPTRVTPNETRIQTKISKEEAMRLAEHNSKYWGPDIGPPRIGGIAVDATLFRCRREYGRGWSGPRETRHGEWVWNVTLKYPEGVLHDGEIYRDMWINAQNSYMLADQ